MTNTNQPVVIDETDLDTVNGGLLLPAVQKVREAAARSTAAADVNGDGRADLVVGSGGGSLNGGTGHLKP